MIIRKCNFAAHRILLFSSSYSTKPSNLKSPSILQQYKGFEQKYPGKLIAMQVGDFFEFFGAHATSASTILDLALGRWGGVDFTGFPIRSMEMHLPKLLRGGQEVVVCEQYKKKLQPKSFMRRVTRVLTPGTTVEDGLMVEAGNNFLLAVYQADRKGEMVSLAWADVGTGEFYYQDGLPVEFLEAEIKRIRPSEVIFSTAFIRDQISSTTIGKAGKMYEKGKSAIEMIRMYYREMNPSATEVEDLSTTMEENDLLEPREMPAGSFMAIDPVDAKALDLFEGESSLFKCLKECITASGGRLLQQRLQYPSMCLQTINGRLDEIESHLMEEKERERIRTGLGGITDIERCLQRLVLSRGSPRDLSNLVKGLDKLGKLKAMSSELTDAITTIDGALEASLPTRIVDGNVIKTEYDTELKELREKGTSFKDAEELVQKYCSETGKDCKLQEIRSYYCFEYSRRQGALSMEGFRHDDSTSARWRYRTDALDALYTRVVQDTDAAKKRETEVYERLINRLLECRKEVQQLIRWMAQVDVATAGAHLARTRSFTRPRFHGSTGSSLLISGGRHPVVESILGRQGRQFTANDLSLDSKTMSFAFITGPNMGGKSTFLRQAALLMVMGQAGMYVPADLLEASLCDAVLTRIGAGDDLANDRSTFMVEMSEAARLLKRATPRSLIILDELGRGTRPEEGTAISAAVANALLRLQSRVLFATHLQGIRKYLGPQVMCLRSVGGVREDGGLVVDHRIVGGVATDACALGVARAAGVPPDVLNDAQRILLNIETP